MARCEKCGFRIRGKSHEKGTHHKEGSCIKPDSKKHMLSTIRGCSYRAEIERHLWNVPLK